MSSPSGSLSNSNLAGSRLLPPAAGSASGLGRSRAAPVRSKSGVDGFRVSSGIPRRNSF